MNISDRQGHFHSALLKIGEASKQGPVSFKQIFALLDQDGHSLLLIFLCLPYLQPLPLPGLSLPLSVIKMVVAWQLYKRRPPVLPKKFEELKLTPQQVEKIVEVAYKVQNFLNRFLRTRAQHLFHSQTIRKLNIVVFIGCAFLLALPMPIPLSNTIPAIPILIMAFAYLEEDGWAMVVSWICSVLALSFFVGLFFFAQEIFIRTWGS